MREPVGLEAVAEACLTAHQLLELHGTSEMQSVSRVLLFQIGREIARREVESDKQLEMTEGNLMRVLSKTR